MVDKDIQTGRINYIDPVTFQYFNHLFNKRTVIYNNEINEDFLEMVILPLIDFEQDESNEEVTLIINTQGGATDCGLVLCNIIDNYKKKLNIIVYTYSYSLGSIIMCAGNKNPNVTKYCYKYTTFLLHAGSLKFSGDTNAATDFFEQMNKTDAEIKKYIINNTNITEDLYEAHYRKEWYFSAEEAKKYGLVDVIIGSD